MFSNGEFLQEEAEEYFKKQNGKNITIAVLAVVCFMLFCLTILFSGLFFENKEIIEACYNRIEELKKGIEKQKEKKVTIEEVKTFFSEGLSGRDSYSLLHYFPDLIRDDWDKRDLEYWYSYYVENLKNEIKCKILENPNCPVSIYWQASREGLNMGYALIGQENLPLELKLHLATKHPKPIVRALALEKFNNNVIPLEIVIQRYYKDRWPVVTEAILRSYDLPPEIYRHAVRNLYHPRLARALVKRGVPEDVVDELSHSKVVQVRETVARDSWNQKILEQLALDEKCYKMVIYNDHAGAQALALAGEKILVNYYGASEDLYFNNDPIEQLLVHENTPFEMRTKAFPIVMRYEKFKTAREAFEKLTRWHKLAGENMAYSFLKSKADAENKEEE